MFGGLNFGSIMNFAAQAAAAVATGGTSLAVSMLARQVLSGVGQQLIQGLGEQLGLPQSVIDVAQGAFAGAMGDAAGATQNWQEALGALGDTAGFSQNSQSNLTNEIRDYIDNMIQDLAQDFAENGGEEEEGGGRAGQASGGGGSWLEKLAEAIGSKLDQLADEFAEKADALDWDNPSEATKFQATSQEFKLMFEALSTSIKTAGESMHSAARKQ